MTNQKINYILIGIVALVIGVLVGLHLAPKPSPLKVGLTPAGGTTFSTDYSSVVLPMSGTATSTSVLNTSGNDLYIVSHGVACEGLGTAKSYVSGSGIASLTAIVATSSTANPITTNANTNTVGGGGATTAITIATSTGNFVQASTTPSGLGAGTTLVGQIWAANTYLTWFFNATTTGQCTGWVYTASS